MAAANGLIDAAEATHNPFVLSFALFAYGHRLPRRRSRPRAGCLAPGPGDRSRQRQPLQRDPPGASLARLEAEHGDPLAALDYVTLAIRNYHDSGNTAMIRTALAVLAAVFDRLGRHEPAATIAGFALSPLTARVPRDQHRDRSPPRCPRRPDLRIARPQGRDDDHRRHGDVRIRPNRPGPSRTERCLEIDHIQDTALVGGEESAAPRSRCLES